ncbi:hypothetical protein [Sulfobacillus sp. hq2]|uniref:hypothetical protein n=1 Tax=Sulfobacillus sp. hq2 TaxID=2039167 RepID=UPI001FA889CD|nr:hypothetical protein [Sulfobacillus sp. hq2]
MMKTFSLVAVGAACGWVLTGCGATHQAVPPQPNKAASRTQTSPARNKSTATPRPTSPSPNLASQPNGTSAIKTSVVTTTAPTVTGPFNPVVMQAMNYVKVHTQVALQAPETIAIPATSRYLAASATASPTFYRVNLQLTKTPMGLNNPQDDSGVNGGLADVLGGFGATEYGSPSGAAATLHQLLYIQPPSSAPQTVNLGTGLTGTRWNSGLVEWHEGDWTLEVVGGSVLGDVQKAQEVVLYLHRHLLPETRGVLEVLNAPDGAHTTVIWQEGSVLYQADDYHSATGAMEMAMSMREYPSGAMPSMDAAATFSTPEFAGVHVRRLTGTQIVPAIAQGYQSPTDKAMVFSSKAFVPLEGFSGYLDGHSFVFDIYQNYPNGLVLGASYHHVPVYFGPGPSPVFSVINFTGDEVVLGNPAAGSYMAINLMTGQRTVNLSAVLSLKGYPGIGLPSHILGLPGTHYSPQIAYPQDPS